MANILKMAHTGRALYLISEAKGMYRSRDEGVFKASASGDNLTGTIVGRLVAGTTSAAAKVGGNTGAATIGTVTAGSTAKTGVYKVRFTTATAFDILAPSGVSIGTGVVATPVTGELGFTIANAGAAMVAGDGFDITVTATPGMYVPHVIGASDGGQTVAGILFETAVKNSIEPRTFTRRDCEVNGAHLVYPTSATAAQIVTINAALLALGIVVR